MADRNPRVLTGAFVVAVRADREIEAIIIGLLAVPSLAIVMAWAVVTFRSRRT